MRLTTQETREIKDAVRKHFGGRARVFLFGSRVDDRKRGGDVDLLVEHEPTLEGEDLVRAKLRTMAAIQLATGDRKIDIVTAPLTEQQAAAAGTEPLILREVRRTGVLL